MRLRKCTRGPWSGLASPALEQYEISNSAGRAFQSRHNLRYWQRRPYLGLGLDASSMAFASHGGGLRDEGAPDSSSRYVLRATTTSDLKDFLAGPRACGDGVAFTGAAA